MIVIPMAGLSKRFKIAGYDLPKYMLEAKGKTLFEHSVESFANYFDKETFLFIALSAFDTEKFISDMCQKLGILKYHIVILDAPTRGQAETVYLGLKNFCSGSDFPITIFNIDTFRPGFTYPTEFDLSVIDGYLETFIGSGKNWSNVVPFHGNKVKATAEKQELSEYCCTGLYYWSSAKLFISIFESLSIKPFSQISCGEYYIAPMYNDIIQDGANVNFSVVDIKDVVFCGVPSEFIEFSGK